MKQQPKAILRQYSVFGDLLVGKVALDKALMENILAKQFAKITDRELAALLYTSVEAIIDFSRLCRGDRSVGQKISLLFNPHRLDTETTTSESIVSALHKEAFTKGLARAIAWKELSSRNAFYEALQVGFNGIQYVNEFPPVIAREIYCDFNAKRILDPCAGWGGRMIGAASVGAYYHAFEPSKRTYEGLLQLGEWLCQFETGFSFRIENIPFEDAKLTGKYDVALTSPPYFDTEHYAPDESTQARVRWPTLDKFCKNFYLPMIHKATAATNGKFILNIGDRKYPMTELAKKGSPKLSFKELKKYNLSQGAGVRSEERQGESFWLVS